MMAAEIDSPSPLPNLSCYSLSAPVGMADSLPDSCSLLTTLPGRDADFLYAQIEVATNRHHKRWVRYRSDINYNGKATRGRMGCKTKINNVPELDPCF